MRPGAERMEEIGGYPLYSFASQSTTIFGPLGRFEGKDIGDPPSVSMGFLVLLWKSFFHAGLRSTGPIER